MSGGEIIAVVVALISLTGTVVAAMYGYRAQRRQSEVTEKIETRSIEASDRSVAAEMYDELVRNQAERIKHLETRERELDSRIQALTQELDSTKRELRHALNKINQLQSRIDDPGEYFPGGNET